MKRTPIVLCLFSAAAFVVTVGCKKESDVPSVEPARDASVQLDRMKEETKEAVGAAKDYAYAQKAEYAAKIRAEMAELNKDLDALSAKVESSSATAKAEAKAKLQDVREKVSRLGDKLDNVQNATESTWEDVKAGVKKGYDEVKDSFNDFRSWLSDKIAP